MVYLNAFEIDTPAIENQISFPTPAHRDERVDAEDGGSIAASWFPPSETASISYDVYFGNTPDDLEIIYEGLNRTTATLSGKIFSWRFIDIIANRTFQGLNTVDTFYWRVDVVSPERTYVGRVFTFRLAQLAFPGAEGYGYVCILPRRISRCPAIEH